MTVTCVVQARTGSTRLPRKVLAPVADRPMLSFLLQRLARTPSGVIDHLVVATSVAAADDEIESIARAEGFAVVRGSEGDVLARFGDALDAFPGDLVVRITADCPLTDPQLVAQIVRRAQEAGADYTSNTLERTYPDGLDVEVVTSDALRAAMAESNDPDEREHVTPFVYRRPDRFRLESYVGPDQLGDERWTVDTADDLARIRDIVGRLDDPLAAGWRDVLAVAGRTVTPEPPANPM